MEQKRIFAPIFLVTRSKYVSNFFFEKNGILFFAMIIIFFLKSWNTTLAASLRLKLNFSHIVFIFNFFESIIVTPSKKLRTSIYKSIYIYILAFFYRYKTCIDKNVFKIVLFSICIYINRVKFLYYIYISDICIQYLVDAHEFRPPTNSCQIRVQKYWYF